MSAASATLARAPLTVSPALSVCRVGLRKMDGNGEEDKKDLYKWDDIEQCFYGAEGLLLRSMKSCTFEATFNLLLLTHGPHSNDPVPIGVLVLAAAFHSACVDYLPTPSKEHLFQFWKGYGCLVDCLLDDRFQEEFNRMKKLRRFDFNRLEHIVLIASYNVNQDRKVREYVRTFTEGSTSYYGNWSQNASQILNPIPLISWLAMMTFTLTLFYMVTS